MIKEKGHISMGTAALLSGLTLFLPTAPYAELYVFPKLVIPGDAAKIEKGLPDFVKFN